MNQIKILLLTVVCLGFGLLSTSSSAAPDTPPVAQLKQLLKTDKEFRQALDAALDGVAEMPGSNPNPWRGKAVEYLYDFFNQWYYFLPTADDGLDRILEFSLFYYHNPAGLKWVREEPGRGWLIEFAEAKGRYMDSKASAAIVDTWLSNPALDNEDFVLPPQGFSSFNDFFTRDLKPGARVIDGVEDETVIVSPADCVLNHLANELSLNSQIPMKGRMSMDLEALLGGSPYAGRFVGGTALACFLMPNFYHHYHAPVSGMMVESREDVGDRLFGVEDLPAVVNKGNPGYNVDLSVLEHFRHGYFIIKTTNYGLVAVVPVGLQTVGSVVFEDKFNNVSSDRPEQIYKGDKLGHFAYGGSTVLVLFEKDRFRAVSTHQGQRIGQFSTGSH